MQITYLNGAQPGHGGIVVSALNDGIMRYGGGTVGASSTASAATATASTSEIRPAAASEGVEQIRNLRLRHLEVGRRRRSDVMISSRVSGGPRWDDGGWRVEGVGIHRTSRAAPALSSRECPSVPSKTWGLDTYSPTTPDINLSSILLATRLGCLR